MYADLQNEMTSSQRLIEFTDLDLEDDLIKDGDKDLQGWPYKGEIVFDSITMRYRPGLEPSVNDLSFKI
jgi:ABC-type multidrug transport system fused ATPase/permease subunit